MRRDKTDREGEAPAEPLLPDWVLPRLRLSHSFALPAKVNTTISSKPSDFPSSLNQKNRRQSALPLTRFGVMPILKLFKTRKRRVELQLPLDAHLVEAMRHTLLILE